MFWVLSGCVNGFGPKFWIGTGPSGLCPDHYFFTLTIVACRLIKIGEVICYDSYRGVVLFTFTMVLAAMHHVASPYSLGNKRIWLIGAYTN